MSKEFLLQNVWTYTYKGVVSITWIVNDNGKYPSFYWLKFITVLYHILLKPEFLLQREGNKYSGQRSLPHFSLTERLAEFLSYNKFYPKRKRIASCLREIESCSIENGNAKTIATE